MSRGWFWRTKQFCRSFTPVDQLELKLTYCVQWALYSLQHYAISVSDGWLHEVQWVLCTAFWSMDMTGVYACLCEALCGVATVLSHPKLWWSSGFFAWHSRQRCWSFRASAMGPTQFTEFAIAETVPVECWRSWVFYRLQRIASMSSIYFIWARARGKKPNIILYNFFVLASWSEQNKCYILFRGNGIL